MTCVTDLQPDWRQRKKAATRERIRGSALRLFREQGYDATTVEQIAAAAGVSLLAVRPRGMVNQATSPRDPAFGHLSAEQPVR